MKNRIQNELEKIEKEYNVKIIYACESGSRAWGFPSSDSDWDVRIVYYHNFEWYLKLEKTRDVIEKPIIDELDISGWDIKKTLALLAKSNPNILEWANSPIVYKETKEFQIVRELLEKGFNPKASYYHYINMAKTSFKQCQKEDVKIKKYLYTIRPLMCALWVIEKKIQPPMLYNEMIEEIIKDETVKEELEMLIEIKQDIKELDLVPKNKVLDEWILQSFQILENTEIEDNKEINWDIFNEGFIKVVSSD